MASGSERPGRPIGALALEPAEARRERLPARRGRRRSCRCGRSRRSAAPPAASARLPVKVGCSARARRRRRRSGGPDGSACQPLSWRTRGRRGDPSPGGRGDSQRRAGEGLRSQRIGRDPHPVGVADRPLLRERLARAHASTSFSALTNAARSSSVFTSVRRDDEQVVELRPPGSSRDTGTPPSTPLRGQASRPPRRRAAAGAP